MSVGEPLSANAYTLATDILTQLSVRIDKMITQEKLKEHLNYNPETGVFSWIKPTGDRVKPGYVAGCNKGDYTIIRIGKIYYAHRLAFLYMTGSFPKKHVDHINGSGRDNRWENIREVCPSENHKNRGISERNKSGSIGVFWSKSRLRWVARIKVNGKNIHIGQYVNIEDAKESRLKAELLHGFHVNHGKRNCHTN